MHDTLTKLSRTLAETFTCLPTDSYFHCHSPHHRLRLQDTIPRRSNQGPTVGLLGPMTVLQGHCRSPSFISRKEENLQSTLKEGGNLNQFPRKEDKWIERLKG